ncbi:MAG: YggS family pyridoxal phosphate-dependent enzyme [Deltaproteobacteria bacterium]|nr:YggS family pyridoxal phosphate-dependent enzyme [Deltaproteobacteria bacterium]
MDLSFIPRNLADVKARIARAAERIGRDPAGVRLVAITKTKGADHVRAALDAGHTLFGENYVQELLSKSQLIGTGAEWHLVGHLQTNKVKKVVGVAAAIQTLDRIDLAAEVEKRAAAAGTTMDCLVEVNLAGEASKTGTAPGEVASLVRAFVSLPHVRVRGLMCVPPFLPPDQVRRYFKNLREMLARITNEMDPGPGFCELSMGMSGDFEAAVEEGATIVRVGTAIFGQRG